MVCVEVVFSNMPHSAQKIFGEEITMSTVLVRYTRDMKSGQRNIRGTESKRMTLAPQPSSLEMLPFVEAFNF
jgi:hypothetical protein